LEEGRNYSFSISNFEFVAMNKDAVVKYYSDTQFEYGLIWNWRLKTTPALHFGYYDDKASTHQQAIIRANEVLADYANIQLNARIVDAGCGLGQSSEWLAKHRNARVTGITITSRQVEAIHKSCKNSRYRTLIFLLPIICRCLLMIIPLM
jgi:cyclopropane fatty-acyl-phospholipid synthase-like methyltransferase